jgi:hypothetical protein
MDHLDKNEQMNIEEYDKSKLSQFSMSYLSLLSSYVTHIDTTHPYTEDSISCAKL